MTIEVREDDHAHYRIRFVAIDGQLVDEATAVRVLTFDQLLEIGLCECGVWFDEHPPLVRNPLALRSWQSLRQSEQPWRNTLTGRAMTRAQAEFTNTDQRRRAGMERTCQNCLGPIPATRHPNAKSCSTACSREYNAELTAQRDKDKRDALRARRGLPPINRDPES